tara:strand:- start:297914 stop:298117 length:204 start_codon:yes stop_codon:yes gene_type:complete
MLDLIDPWGLVFILAEKPCPAYIRQCPSRFLSGAEGVGVMYPLPYGFDSAQPPGEGFISIRTSGLEK